jgi:uncharacterized membrane protein (DUF2068 family)
LSPAPACPPGLAREHRLRTRNAESRGPALRLIIAYKFARAAAALSASGVLVAFTSTGRASVLNDLVKELHRHVTSAWSIEVANVLVGAIAPRHLWMVAAALALDGTLTVVEACSLQRGWWWGPWLVVAVTSGFVPFEIVALQRHLTVGKIVLLAANLIVALYLARHALRRNRR